MRNASDLPPLTIAQILAWADSHHARTGTWPSGKKVSGRVLENRNETWIGINRALQGGGRGLDGGLTLAKLLARERKWSGVNGALGKGALGVRGLRGRLTLPQLLARYRGVHNRLSQRLTVRRILAWADAHFEQTGHWPEGKSGSIIHAPGETWSAVDHALKRGDRGLPGGATLLGVLGKHRGFWKKLRPSKSFTL